MIYFLVLFVLLAEFLLLLSNIAVLINLHDEEKELTK